MLLKQGSHFWGPFLPACAVVLVGLTVSAVVAHSMHEAAREFDQARFQRLVQQQNSALRDRMEKYNLALQGLAEFVASQAEVPVAEWRFRIRRLWPEQNYPGLLEIGFALLEPLPAVTSPPGALAPEVTAPVPVNAGSEWEAQSLEDASLKRLRLMSSWVRPPSASDGVSPQFLAEPDLVEAARLAVQTGDVLVLPGRQFSAEVGGNPANGFTILAPTRRAEPDRAGNALEAGGAKRALPGVVFGNVVPALLLENLFGTAQRELDFEIFTGNPASAANWLKDHSELPRSLGRDFRPYLQTNVLLHLPPHQWMVNFHTTPLFEGSSQRERPAMALMVGALLTLLVAALMVVQARARLNQQEIAAELRAACDDLQTVQAERDRLSRDLHDGAIQSLYGLQLSLDHYERQLQRRAQGARETLAGCRAAVDALIVELRAFLVQQLPGEEDPARQAHVGAALQQLVHRFQSASRIPIELVLKDSPPTPVTLGQQIHLRQITQEAISNSLRHGQPRHIRVELQRQPQGLQLRVQDDGLGFDAGQGHPGQGLANMHARAMQLGGQLRVNSGPGRGTCVTFEMPLARQPSLPHEQEHQNPIAHRG